MKNKVILLLAIVILISQVSALGITPARTTVDFKPGLEQEIPFSVLNSEQKDIFVVVYAQGELNSSIYLKENSFSMSSQEAEKRLSYSIKLPQELSPGLHTADVVVLQLPDKAKTSEAFIGAAVGVTTQLYVYVPYPGKYAEGQLSVIGAEQGGEVTFVISVVNRGNLDLARVKANIDIYNGGGDKVTSFNTEPISIKGNEKSEIVSKWKADAPLGSYRAVVTVLYDEQTFTLEREFNIGSRRLELQQVEVGSFNLGEIAKFEMLVENKWSDSIIGAYAQTNVLDAEGKVMADFKSPTYDIKPLEKKILVSFWDTAGVKTGTYDASIFLKYAEKSEQQNVKFEVSNDKINVIGLGYVISEKGKSSTGSNLTVLLGIGIGVLILINVLWFLYLRKRLLTNRK